MKKAGDERGGGGGGAGGARKKTRGADFNERYVGTRDVGGSSDEGEGVELGAGETHADVLRGGARGVTRSDEQDALIKDTTLIFKRGQEMRALDGYQDPFHYKGAKYRKEWEGIYEGHTIDPDEDIEWVPFVSTPANPDGYVYNLDRSDGGGGNLLVNVPGTKKWSRFKPTPEAWKSGMLPIVKRDPKWEYGHTDVDDTNVGLAQYYWDVDGNIQPLQIDGLVPGDLRADLASAGKVRVIWETPPKLKGMQVRKTLAVEMAANQFTATGFLEGDAELPAKDRRKLMVQFKQGAKLDERYATAMNELSGLNRYSHRLGEAMRVAMADYQKTAVLTQAQYTALDARVMAFSSEYFRVLALLVRAEAGDEVEALRADYESSLLPPQRDGASAETVAYLIATNAIVKSAATTDQALVDIQHWIHLLAAMKKHAPRDSALWRALTRARKHSKALLAGGGAAMRIEGPGDTGEAGGDSSGGSGEAGDSSGEEVHHVTPLYTALDDLADQAPMAVRAAFSAELSAFIDTYHAAIGRAALSSHELKPRLERYRALAPDTYAKLSTYLSLLAPPPPASTDPIRAKHLRIQAQALAFELFFTNETTSDARRLEGYNAAMEREIVGKTAIHDAAREYLGETQRPGSMDAREQQEFVKLAEKALLMQQDIRKYMETELLKMQDEAGVDTVSIHVATMIRVFREKYRDTGVKGFDKFIAKIVANLQSQFKLLKDSRLDDIEAEEKASHRQREDDKGRRRLKHKRR